MSDLKVATGFAFDRGIDSVVHAHGDAPAELPQLQEGPPCAVIVRPHVDSLLYAPTLDDLLDDAVRPQIEARHLMAPVHFRQALDHVLQVLRGRAGELQTGTHHDNASAPTLLVLSEAISLLTQECHLRDMVQTYRSALYQA